MYEDLDPFLIAHRVGHGEFDMAGKYSPAAVRDQMNRAVAIVERAWLVGLLEKSSKFLVKGCGAAGVSAAMQAVKLGVGSVTITADGPFFDRQRRSHRMIDPVEYDWPAEGWEQGDAPPSGARVPLPYVRGRAKKIVATMWIPAWDAFRRAHAGKQLHVVDAATGAAIRAERTLDCTGPGSERTEVGAGYRWFPFWENDPLELAQMGFERETRRRDVLISGGGDGALQDFLRVLFPGGRSPRDLYLELGLSRETRLELEWRILNAEDRARRAWVWSAHGGIDCGILDDLHRAHREVAAWVLPAVRERLAEMLTARTTDLNRLWLSHECTHFSPCYAFNRFLVLLVDEYCKGLAGVDSRLLEGRRLRSVTSGAKSHKCAKAMEQCLLHPHVAEYVSWHCGDEQRTARTIPGGEFDLVVVRHGLTGAVKRLSRQALPYVLPTMP